jgi:hypothetical protein
VRAILLAALIAVALPATTARAGDDYRLPRSVLKKRNVVDPVIDRMIGALAPDANDDREMLRHATKGERLIWILWSLDYEISNGGYYQLFWNSAGDHAEEGVRDAQAIRANRWAGLLAEAIRRTFPAGVPHREIRMKLLGCPDYCAKRGDFGDLEGRWRGVSPHLTAYIRAHPDEFFRK